MPIPFQNWEYNPLFEAKNIDLYPYFGKTIKYFYSDDDPKYALLKGSGFKYFMINETETPGFLQVEDGYMRQAIYEINTYEDFESAVAG